MMMDIFHLKNVPEIGDLVTVDWAIEIAGQFPEMDYIVKRLQKGKGNYEPFIFDGCSCLPDKLLGIFNGRFFKWSHITYLCCLPHDICYAYGDDEEAERPYVDKHFRNRLHFKAGVPKILAACFYLFVKKFGYSRLNADFSWGFACKTTDAVTILKNRYQGKSAQRKRYSEKMKRAGYEEVKVGNSLIYVKPAVKGNK